MIYLSDETATKLHTGTNGVIWYSVGLNPPENSNQSLDTFLLSHHIARISTCVRVLGVPQNAELLTSLYSRKTRRELAGICVAGPNMCESMQELVDPVVTLLRMRDVYAAASCGGWHEMTESEYIVYSLLNKQKRGADWFDKSAATIYAAHPLYPVINFVRGINHKAAAELMGTIIDPRWYVDKRRPDNPSKLELFLGLTPRIQTSVSAGPGSEYRGRYARCRQVLNCWKTQDAESVDFDAPENFLWRIWRSHGGTKGDLRASQVFVRYLRANWIDALIQRKGVQDKFFMADRFFKASAERTAFLAHLS